jgi:hypothetical protein
MRERKTDLSVRRNSNYTISVVDGRGRELCFRDITGEDLEFLDHIIEPQTSEEEQQDREINFDQVVSILELLSTDKLDLKILPRRILSKVFNLVKDNILCNYMTKYNWLRHCYGIQNGSFANLGDMERVPMTKFVAMVDIHSNAMESLPKDA